MKVLFSYVLSLMFFISCTLSNAQNSHNHIDSLLRQGVILNDGKKFPEAIAKFDEVLKVDPNNATALFEKGFSLSASGKDFAAIPLFEKIISTSKMPEAYTALGNIYDNKGDFEKAQNIYKTGITAYPNNESLWYNLSVSYLRSKKYSQAELAAIESIKTNPKHAASYQTYGFATYFQGKNAMALLALANFLMFTPSAGQAKISCQYLKQILKTSASSAVNSSTKLQQETIEKAASEAVLGKTNLTVTDSLRLQLTSVFKAIQANEVKFQSSFYSKYFGDFFGALANTNNMDVFTHFITIAISPQENISWLKAHPEDVKAFNIWVSSQKRLLN